MILDKLGREIRAGDKAVQLVSGNYSTSYREVTVLEVTKRSYENLGCTTVRIKIQKDDGTVSTIKIPTNLIVLRSD